MKTKRVIALPYDEAAKKYSLVKATAAKLFPDDIDKYIEYKSPCIEELYGQCGLGQTANNEVTE